MAKLQLSLAVLANDRSRPIIDGTVRPEGVDFTVTVGKSAGEIFWRQLHFQEFDVSEMSLSEMLMLVSRGDRSWLMLPVFMTRRFFHTNILVRTDAGITQPRDLQGKRVGVAEYIQTAGLWARGVLQDEFGVMPRSVKWFQERSESMSHSTMFGLQSSGLFQHIPDDKTIGAMMLAGELDATINYSGVPNLVDRSSTKLRAHPAVRPLFPNSEGEDHRYYQKTGIFPMNHGPVIRRSIVERHPWVVLNLYQAFIAAKRQAAARAKELVDMYVSLGQLSPETQAVLKSDPLPYGIKKNRNALETCARYSYEQGLSPRIVAIDELFADATLSF